MQSNAPSPRIARLLFIGALLVVGCGDDVDQSPEGTASLSTTTTTTTATTTSTGPGGGDANAGGGGSDAGFGGGGANAGGGPSCSPEIACDDGFFCDYPDDKCGTGKPGTCKQLGNSDCGAAPLACGCDDKIGESCYGSVSFGPVDIAEAANCTTPVGYFVCGNLFCDTASQYCQVTPGAECGAQYICAPGSCDGAMTCPCLLETLDPKFHCSGEAGYRFDGLGDG